jgi:hypothetical protein
MVRTFIACALLLAACASCTKSKAPEAPAEKTAPPPAEAKRTVEGVKATSGPPGVRSEGKGFVLVVTPPDGAAAGAASAASVTLSPTTGYHLNKEYPTSLKVTAPDGVTCDKADQKVEDAKKFEEQGAEFAVACTAAAPGEKQFIATFKFAVCTATTCDPKTEKLAWNVAVK